MQVAHGSRAAPNWNASIPAWLMPYAQKNSRSQILLVSCLLLDPFHLQETAHIQQKATDRVYAQQRLLEYPRQTQKLRPPVLARRGYTTAFPRRRSVSRLGVSRCCTSNL